MTLLGALRRFFGVWEAYGLRVASNVILSKLRGTLNPAEALPGPPVYATRRRLSFLIRVEEHEPATINAIAAAVSAAEGAFEVVFCERAVTDASGSVASRLRGARPWFRFVGVTQEVDARTAASWTVEQATGRYVAFIARGCAPESADIERLLTPLEEDDALSAAGLFETSESGEPLRAIRLLALRKSLYLARFPLTFPMTAPALLEALAKSGTPVLELPYPANRERAGRSPCP